MGPGIKTVKKSHRISSEVSHKSPYYILCIFMPCAISEEPMKLNSSVCYTMLLEALDLPGQPRYNTLEAPFTPLMPYLFLIATKPPPGSEKEEIFSINLAEVSGLHKRRKQYVLLYAYSIVFTIYNKSAFAWQRFVLSCVMHKKAC